MKTLTGFLAAGMLLVSTFVFAGWSGDFPVEIDWENQWAGGLPVTVRFSDNPDETIGCGVRHRLTEEGGLYSWAFCRATIDPPENQIFCYTENTGLVDKIAELNHYSFVSFRWEWDEELGYDKCTAFNFTTQAHHIPEGVGPKHDDDDHEEDD